MAKKVSRRAKSAGRTGGPRTSRGSVRRQVHDFTLRLACENDLSLGELPGLAKQVVSGAAEGLGNAVPKGKSNVLRQVVDGVTDAVAAAAKAAGNAASSVAHRGATFARTDGKKTARELGRLEGEVLSSLTQAAKSLKGAARTELETIVAEARKAGTKIKPAAESVLRATDGRLVELGKESVAASERVVRSTTRTALEGASGFLQGLADALKGAGSGKTGTRPAGAKARRKSGR